MGARVRELRRNGAEAASANPQALAPPNPGLGRNGGKAPGAGQTPLVRNKVLERLARGGALTEILELLARELEREDSEMRSSIILLDHERRHIHVAAAPSLPPEYCAAIEGLAIGPNAGSCGRAAFLGERVVVSDIASDPLWAAYRELALAHGLRACWSEPILAGDGEVLGTLAMYFGSVRTPTPEQVHTISHAANLASIAIERKHAEGRIARLTNLYRAHSEISKFIVRATSECALLAEVCRIAVEFGGMRMAWIGMPEESTALFRPLAAHGEGLEYLEGLNVSSSADVPEGCGPAGRAFREGRPQTVQNFSTDSETAPWHQRAHAFDFRSAGAFPIQRAGKVYATLSVYSSRRSSFDRESCELLEEITKDVGFALDSLDGRRERKAALEALRRSEQHFRAYFERSMIGMAATGPDRRWIEVNDALCAMLGYTREQMLATSWTELTHFDGRSDTDDGWARLCDGQIEEYEAEERYRHKDGHAVHTRIAGRAVRAAPGGPMDYVVLLVMDISELKRSAELIWKQANLDILTELPNRYLFQQRLAREIEQDHGDGRLLALLFIDLDEFKEVNDTLGHDIGDALLVAVARRISACVRASDTVARLGGDEFTVILPQLENRNIADRLAQTIIARLAEAFPLRNQSIFLSASVGITIFPSDAQTVDGLLRNADQAMYAAKHQGRNQVGFFTAELQQEAQKRLHLINDLRGALAAGQFQVYFQPVVDLVSRRICGAEALLRWNHPTRGLVLPGEFITLAEETGLIIGIGEWVFREAARWAKRWVQCLGADFWVSVNNSPVQFRDAEKILARLEYLREIGLPGKNITIEITEGLLLEADDTVTALLQLLHGGGMRVAIDDFGTGYSSLSYLHRLQIDCLKIDQSFIRNLGTERGTNAISEAIIVMAHKLGLSVVAEGVETTEQMGFLVASDCDYAQGYLFSRPVPPEHFEDLIREGRLVAQREGPDADW